MGFFDSKSSSKQNQSTLSSGAQSQAGAAASINVTSGKKSRNTINVVSTDHGAVNSSFSFADRSAGRSFAYADKSANRSFEFANKVLSFAERTQKQAVETMDKSAAINAKSQSASLTALASFREEAAQKPGDSTAMKSAFLLALAAVAAPIITKRIA